MIAKADPGIPPPPRAPAPVPPGTVTQVDVRSRVAAWSAWAADQGDFEKPRQYHEQEETPEMMAARIDRDVQILNHILDDIEFFITKLQKAAEAFSELSKRKKSKKSKRKGPGGERASGQAGGRAQADRGLPHSKAVRLEDKWVSLP